MRINNKGIPMKTYQFLIACLITISLGWGLLAPTLVSSKSTSLVFLGFVITFIIPVLLWDLYKRWSKTDEGQKIIKRILK